MQAYHRVKYENGKREFYIFGIKIFQYYTNKFKKAKRCCNIPYNLLKKWYRENNLKLIHQVGIVISDRATIGKNCTIYQNVTIGRKGEYAPTLGDNVTIYANAVVIGNVHIGDNAVIGAGSIVLKDIPAGEVWAGNPAHFIKKTS
ncbi:MAG: serine acetyltransferase [Acetobacter sp.]|nr:serine acetyltransferase [Acetobacter sp.]